MPYQPGFRRKLFIYYFSIFLLFTLAVMLFQYNREKEIRIEALDYRLNDMSGLVDNYITTNSLFETDNFSLVDSIYRLIPVKDLRITIIAIDGKVLYDSSVDEWSGLGNHLLRPEVSKSHYSPYGTAVRKSASTGKEYYYFSKYYDRYYVRIAEEYNINLQSFLKRGKVFLIFIAFTFIIVWVLLSAVTKRMGRSVTMIRDFAARIRRGEGNDRAIVFPEDEIGETGKEIVRIYNNLVQNSNELALQKEKLFRHLHVLNEGVAFFSPDAKVTLSNNHFLVFLSTIAGDHSLSPERFLELPQFSEIKGFIEKQQHISRVSGETPVVEFHTERAGRHFSVRCILFHDNSFEIVITDITQAEQAKAMRQQMTSNIAHELKTPVASVRGYLETLLERDLDDEKKKYFIEKALAQSTRLSDLINDIVTLNKLDEGAGSFTFEELNVTKLIHEVTDNMQTAISRRNIKVDIDIPEDMTITANRSLIVSVFQNLMENAVTYAGDKISVIIRSLPDEAGYHFFSFADTGSGIPEEHQARIFERFYRVDDGRARKSGGTGLGLAIVKNAILLHKGEISVRTRPGGGTEFIFSVPA